jgi:hypothetical protein
MADFTAGDVLTAVNLENAINGATLGSVTTNYTLTAADAGKLIQVNSTAAATVTVPPASSVAYTAGAAVAVVQTGAGQVTIAAGSGVTVNSAGSALKISNRYGAVQLYELSDNNWVCFGNLTT